MKIFYIVRNDHVDYDEYDSAVVIAESPEESLRILKEDNLEGIYCPWGKYDVTITEVIPDAPRIVIESFNAG